MIWVDAFSAMAQVIQLLPAWDFTTGCAKRQSVGTSPLEVSVTFTAFGGSPYPATVLPASINFGPKFGLKIIHTIQNYYKFL